MVTCSGGGVAAAVHKSDLYVPPKHLLSLGPPSPAPCSADKLGREAVGAAAAAAAGLGPPHSSKESSLARAFAKAASAATPSSFSSDLSSGSAPDGGATGSPGGTATPSAADTELAWEAGFRAGQEAAALAAHEEWHALVAKRMQYLGHVQSDHILSAADVALGQPWAEVGGRVETRRRGGGPRRRWRACLVCS